MFTYSCVGKILLSEFWTTALVEVIVIAPHVVLSLCCQYLVSAVAGSE